MCKVGKIIAEVHFDREVDARRSLITPHRVVAVVLIESYQDVDSDYSILRFLPIHG